MEVPWFVIAGIADGSTNSLLSACVGEWVQGARNLIASVICALVPSHVKFIITYFQTELPQIH